MARYYTYYLASKTNTPQQTGGGTQEPDFRFFFDVSYTQNLSANKSIVTVNKYVDFDYTPQVVHPIYANSFISGVEYQSEKNMPVNTLIGLVGTDTREIQHNADGTGSFTFQGAGSGYYEQPYYGWTRTSLVTIPLPQIPRKSDISVTPTSQNIGSQVTFNIDRKVSSYTHDLTYNLNGSTGTIDTGVGTSKVWTLPTSLYNILSSAESGTMTVTCTTKNGSTVIGTSTCTLTANVPTSIKPSVSLELSDVGDTPSAWGIWLKAKSKVRGVIGATPGTGASIIGYSGSANNQNFSSTPFTTGYLTMSGSHTVRATAKDSRQRTSAEATQTISIVDYWNPTISNFQVKRCNADGSLNEKGEHAKAIITYSIAPCSNKNTRGLTVTQGGTTKTITLIAYSGTVESEVFSGMATTNSYAFSCSLSDYFTSTPQTFSLGTAKRAFSLKHNEQGAAFGETALEDGLIVAEDWKFKAKGDALINKNLTVGNIQGKNLFNINNTINGTSTMTIDNNTITFSSSPAWGKINNTIRGLKPNTTYIINYNVSNNVGTMRLSPRILENINVEVNPVNLTTMTGNLGTTITTSSTGNIIIYMYNNFSGSGITNNAILSNIQLEEGTQTTNYIPYQGIGYTSGSNSNGSWVKYDDGRMECWNTIGLGTKAYTTQYGSVYHAARDTIQFPQTFINTPDVVVTGDITGGVGLSATKQSVSTTNFQCWLAYPTSTSLATSITYQAKGRWK